MSQATLSERPYTNSNLFSGHYLDERISYRDEWDCDEEALQALEELQTLYKEEQQLVSGYREDALVDNWIDKVLEVLGFGTNVETTLPDGSGYVDTLLFENTGARRNAATVYLDTEDTTDLFEGGIGLLEAKQWDADFNQRFSEQRPYRNASHQVKHYLERTPENIQWGILTNGRKWRLYGTKDYETQTYYEVDLPELLEHGELEAFKYFYLFFRPEAFRAHRETTFLDTVWSESETVAKELGEDLQDNVFTALRVLGRGFVETNDLEIDPDNDEDLAQLKEQSLVLLYRLMFVLYAESRGLIHPEGKKAITDYEENFSLDELRLEIYDEIGEIDDGFDAYSEYSTSMWGRLKDLFRLIDEGEENLGIPPYNGGLFNREKHEFLSNHEVSNRYLAEVIYRISTTENDEERYVLADYADLDTRHLGSVYEGLLEHQFRIAPEDYAAVAEDGGQVWKPATEVSVADAVETVDKGGLYVVNDEGERKATGAYYTPDYVVTYIVEETVGPLVEEIQEDLEDQGFEPGTHEYLGAFYKRVKGLKILDPAMGSGHFLTRATEYLAQQVMEEVRELEGATAFDEQRVRRDVAKECIYGVDLNGMAVELAKLSMWLETLAADQPLAFLDHHLKAGNSLVGSDVTEVLSSDTEDSSGQLTLQQALARVRQDTLEHVMDRMQELLEIDNETLEDVRSMEEIYDEVRSDPFYQRLFELTNVHTAERFELEVPDEAYEQMAQAIDSTEEWDTIREEDWFQTAQAICNEEASFHWELEYPEVFFDEDGEKREDAGFDAVIGNPPWLNAWSMTEKAPKLRTAITSLFDSSDALKGHWDLYVPFVIKSLRLCRKGGNHSFILPNTVLTEKYANKLRKELLEEHSISSLLSFEERTVFEGVERQCIIYSLTTGSDRDQQHALRICTGVDPFTFEDVARTNISTWLNAYNYQIRVDPNYVRDYIPILDKIESSSTLLGQYLYVNVGATVSSEKSKEFSKSDVVNREPIGNAKRFFQGTNVNKWSIDWDNEWLDYRRDEMSGPRHSEMFEAEKVAIRVRTNEGGELAAAYDDEGMYCDHTVLVCCKYEHLDSTSATTEFDGFDRENRDLNLKYVLALINSTLMTWLFKNKFETGGLQGTYSDVWPQSVRSFPIPENHDEIQCELQEQLQETTQIDCSSTTTPESLLVSLSDVIIEGKEQLKSLNLSLLDHLGSYSEGQTLADVGFPQPPTNTANSILTDTAEVHENLRVGDVNVIRESPTSLEIRLTARYKPEDKDEYETDRWGYTETDLQAALRLSELSETEANLIEAFVPLAIDEAGGFANFRETATKTNSPVDRLRALTLPAVDDVRDGLENYLETKVRAEELETRIEKTDQHIDEIVYELYGLTEEEIEIVEQSVDR
ncbi:N-6 DNA methylase [Natronococcus sp. JC468]|uniref:Eco57I restriction-modification methylase domain-containing protein n=1 Tax=Natronococcus sp. JC468 TaxID=1961921 RepID=UPI00143B6DEB|nr:TaqI-like C-terminal specificity domain-containing protein [Natronococcus sp. JC468]NKE37464.1 N-6 DNA methylase [Natronococcus sp. JC468]